MVKSRALREKVVRSELGQGPGGAFERYCFPLADMLNHEPSCIPSLSSSLLQQADVHQGPSVRGKVVGEQFEFAAVRDIPAGGEVTWTYGELTNEELLLQYGFVPSPPVHGDSRIGFCLPSSIFETSLQSLSKDRVSQELLERKRSLLQQLAVVDTSGQARGGAYAHPEASPAGANDADIEDHVLVLGGRACNCLLVDVRRDIWEDRSCTPAGDLGPEMPPDVENEIRAFRWTSWLLSQEPIAS
eukprot:482185-Hanusia_phi.AAC.2